MLFLRRHYPPTALDINQLKRTLNRQGSDIKQWELRESRTQIVILARVWGVWAARPLLIYNKRSQHLSTRADRVKSATLVLLLITAGAWLFYHLGISVFALMPMALALYLLLSRINLRLVAGDFDSFVQLIDGCQIAKQPHSAA